MNTRHILSQSALVIGTLFFAVGLQAFAQAWTPPACSPPNCNAYAPLNTSPTAQAKTAGLLLNSGTTGTAAGAAKNGLIVEFGNVGIGTTNPGAELALGGIAGVDGIKFPDGTLQTTAAGGGKVILCHKNIYYGFNGAGMYAFTFSASDCGGTLPDNTYMGVQKEVFFCNGDTGQTRVLDTGESAATSHQGTVPGPGIEMWLPNPCTWSTGSQGEMEIVYIPTSASVPVYNTQLW